MDFVYYWGKTLKFRDDTLDSHLDGELFALEIGIVM